MQPFPFIGAAYESRSSNWNAQRCVNLYPEIDQSGTAKTPVALIGTPGMLLQATLSGSGGIRALFATSTGVLLAVRGNTVYRLNTSYTATSCGTLLTSSGVVSIADNGEEAMLVDGAHGYTLDLTAFTLAQITDPDFAGARKVDYLDGYFIFDHLSGDSFSITGLFNTAVSGTDFASAEGSPDNLVSLIVDHREVILFGAQSIEVWYNSGNATFPIERLQGAFMEMGCAATHSVAKMDNTVYWLGNDKNGALGVFRAQGYQPARISTHAIEKAIDSYTVTSDAVAYCYHQEGHAFYVITFPSANRTWVFDAATQLWHERASFNTSNEQQRHRSNCHAYFNGKNLVGDFENGNIYALELDAYSDNGASIRRIRQTPYLSNNMDWTIFDQLMIDMETGVGLSTGQGSDPKIMLQWSNDGGHTWSNELTASIGAMGNYSARAIWRRLGRSRSRIFRLTISDPVKCAFTNGLIQARS